MKLARALGFLTAALVFSAVLCTALFLTGKVVSWRGRALVIAAVALVAGAGALLRRWFG